MREFKALFNKTGGWRRFMVLLSIRCPFDALRTALIAVFLQQGFEAIQAGSIEGLRQIYFLFAIGNLLLFLYNGTVWAIFATNEIRWTGTVRKLLFRKITHISFQQLDVKTSGEWITRLNADVRTATAMLGVLQLPHAVVAVVNIGVSVVMLGIVNPMVLLFTLLFSLPHGWINYFVVAKPITLLSAAAQEETARNAGDLSAMVVCAEVSALYDAQDFLLDRYRKSSLAIRHARMKIKKRQAVTNGLLPLIGMSGYLVILFFGARWIQGGIMTFGALTAAYQFRGGIMTGLMMLNNCLLNMKTSLAGVRRVNETLNLPPDC